jgi:hypothetical protein
LIRSRDMDLTTVTLGLPLLPLKGLLAVARLLEEEAERELHDPSRVRRQLEDVEAAEAADELPEEEGAKKKEEILQHLMEGQQR